MAGDPRIRPPYHWSGLEFSTADHIHGHREVDLQAGSPFLSSSQRCVGAAVVHRRIHSSVRLGAREKSTGLTPPLIELGRLPLQLLVIYPLAMGASSVLRGMLIRSARTPSVRAATLVGVGTVVVTLIVGAARLPVSGVLLAATATLMGAFAELLWLFWRGRP